jgi:hypothetical protein
VDPVCEGGIICTRPTATHLRLPNRDERRSHLRSPRCCRSAPAQAATYLPRTTTGPLITRSALSSLLPLLATNGPIHCHGLLFTATTFTSGHRFSTSSTHPTASALLSSFLVGAFPRVAAAPAAHAATISVCAKAKKSVLIVNTNSGGHAVIGFYFAKELLAVGACHHCAHRRGGRAPTRLRSSSSRVSQ